jgi:hypothetical protein
MYANCFRMAGSFLGPVVLSRGGARWVFYINSAITAIR